ncbi:unnamed protein product [Cuscuta campestris]|uniref:Uncharacterized protein n=1 Tax=Cuscuta campestris TaxID=132261 RepID=A0A484N610_9ASTE|nr:unnamed protein product [Cuscuta campestris]
MRKINPSSKPCHSSTSSSSTTEMAALKEQNQRLQKQIDNLTSSLSLTIQEEIRKLYGEQIYSLPGQPKNVTSKQYSGYIVSDDSYGRYTFYYFVEAQSKRSSTLVPLTLWLGGAHGCSSVGNALFTENGPFRPRKDGKLIRNAYSWNLESNMLYVDSPIGTGFSFSNTPSDYTRWNLTMTGLQTYHAHPWRSSSNKDLVKGYYTDVDLET